MAFRAPKAAAKELAGQNHKRQMEYLKKGIVMLPKKPIREKSRHKQLMAAQMIVKAGYPDPLRKRKRARRAEA